MLLRQVELPIAGALYLHSMPGREERFTAAAEEIARRGITRVICLAPPDEIARKSPDYAAALVVGVAWRHDPLPIPDFGVPIDARAFWDHVAGIGGALRDGERVLVHCGAGVGRTGMYAVGVLLALGWLLTDASKHVGEAGSAAETPQQRALLSALARSAHSINNAR